jgi:hypothetical protein
MGGGEAGQAPYLRFLEKVENGKIRKYMYQILIVKNMGFNSEGAYFGKSSVQNFCFPSHHFETYRLKCTKMQFYFVFCMGVILDLYP